MEQRLIVIGASWGGLHAVGTVLEGLGDGGHAAVIVVHFGVVVPQHGLLAEFVAPLPKVRAHGNSLRAAARPLSLSGWIRYPDVFAADAKAPRQMKLANAFCRFSELAAN